MLQAGAAVNVYSLRRMGKTSLLQQIVHLVHSNSNWINYCPARVDFSVLDPSRSMVYMLLRRVGGKRDDLKVDDAWEEFERLTEGTEGQTLLLIDEADGLLDCREEIHERDLKRLRALQQTGRLNIVAVTAYASLADRFQHNGQIVSPFCNIFHSYRLPSFLAEEAIDLLTTLCARGHVLISPELARELAGYVGFYPQMVQEVGEIAFRLLSCHEPASIASIAGRWYRRAVEFWLPTILRLFEKEYVGILAQQGGVSRADYLVESLEAYGVLLKDEHHALTVAPYMRQLLQWNLSPAAEDVLARLQALADSAGRNQPKEFDKNRQVAATSLKSGPGAGVTIGNVSGGIHNSVIAGGDVTIGGPSPTAQPSASQLRPASGHNIASIRDLLEAAFLPQTLRRFCQDRPDFQPVVAEFGLGHGLTEMVDRVIDYCNTRLLFDDLLSEIEKENPKQYERFQPYRS